MHAPSSSPSSPDPPPPQAATPGAAGGQAPPPHQRSRKTWLGLAQWFQQNTFAPQWFPARFRHPLIGYLVAILVELAAASPALLLLDLFPSAAFLGILTLVGVVLIALIWGVGPSLLAAFVGTFLFYYVALPPYFTWSLEDPISNLGSVLYLVVGISISLLAGRSERARRQVEEQRLLLAQAEARSRVDAQRLRAVLDVLPSAVLIAGPQGQPLEMNQATRALWGGEIPLTAEIARDQRYSVRWARTGQPLAPQDWALARALTRGEVVQNHEIEVETPVGQRTVLLTSAAPMRDEEGTITGAVATAQDITEVYRLEREVAERAAQLETIFESIADGIIVTDRQGRVIHMNQAIKTLLGIKQDPTGRTMPQLEALAQYSLRNARGLPLTEAERPINRYLQGEVLTRAHSIDLLIQTRDGRETRLNSTGAPIRDAAGQILGSVQVVRDVTERRRLEQRLRETLDALLAMAESLVQVPEATHSNDSSSVGSDSTLSVTARHLADLTRSVVGCRSVAIAVVEPETSAITPLTVAGLTPEQEQQWWDTCDWRYRLSNYTCPDLLAAVRAGESAVLDTTCQPWQDYFPATTSLLVPMYIGETLVGLLELDDGGEQEAQQRQEAARLTSAVARLGALVMERERLLCEQAEARANELALRTTQAQMETFLGMAGHELKNPLAALKLGIQMTERRLQRRAGCEASPPDFFEQHLAQARRQVERLERLVDDLLDVSRVRAGKLEFSLETSDLRAVVLRAVEEQRQANPARVLLLRFPTSLAVPVFVDAGRIGQVVTNYLTNALKYSPADCPVEVGLDLKDQQARVWVRDGGPGIPPEEQEHVWERFHRVKGIEVQSGTGIGLGLGLHICRIIVERHQGQVGVESAPGKGSTFWFTLPVTSPSAEGQRAG
jgi:PAS domain S-box-containing protein